MLTAHCCFLAWWLFVTQESTDGYFASWVVGAFLVLVAIFVLYQKGLSGWTWRDFADGMLALLIKTLIFIIWTWLDFADGMLVLLIKTLVFIIPHGHFHLPRDDD